MTQPQQQQENAQTTSITRPLITIDTFSGIGGISLALRDFTKTMLYCDVNTFCQRVLSERMKERRLDRAPIHGDIKTLHVPDGFGAEMIMGGSPCTDLSTIGLKQGMVDGPQSSLFFEIVRIVDECPSIQVVFLENVANILKCGIKEVVQELACKRNFDLFWLCKSAASMGAPHMRNRWFCLGVKRGYKIDMSRFGDACSDAACTAMPFPGAWTAPPSSTIAFRPDVHPDEAYDVNWSLRSQCLGNTVVPCVVRSAFVQLLKLHAMESSLKTLLGEAYGCHVDQLDFSAGLPESCAIVDGFCMALPSMLATSGERSKASPASKWTVKLGAKDVLLSSLPTPRRGVSHASSVTSERSLHDLPTILVNSDASVARVGEVLGERYVDHTTKYVVPNVKYIEWMMGYDPDWTRVSGFSCRNPSGGGSRDNKSGARTAVVDGEDATAADANLVAISPVVSGESTDSLRRLNALNLFHKELHPSMNIKDVCDIWRKLTNNEKRTYSDRARKIRMSVDSSSSSSSSSAATVAEA